MEETRKQVRDYVIDIFSQYMPGNVWLWYDALVLIWIAITACLLHFILRGGAKFIIQKYLSHRFIAYGAATKELALRLLSRISFVIQGLVVASQAQLWLLPETGFLHLITVITDQWIIIFLLLVLFTVLDILQDFSDRRAKAAHFPLRGLLQTVKLIASMLTGILSVSLLMDKSPLILLSGLGALSAVLILVFKDAILGLVAGIQLSANNMLAVGDWLEMPKYGADGDVVDIALTTVKVKNWDKTITTIPTYALISDSFKNWRGMSDSGGRRIKRSVRIEMSSVRFLTVEELELLKKADLLSDYLVDKINYIEGINKNTDMSVMLNGRRLTNIGTFRHYLVSLLKHHPQIHNNMTLMVRQLESTSEGLPVEIYAFTNTTNWEEYENIQSDIFDHILAVLPAFSLRAHESPTGHDIRLLTK